MRIIVFLFFFVSCRDDKLTEYNSTIDEPRPSSSPFESMTYNPNVITTDPSKKTSSQGKTREKQEQAPDPQGQAPGPQIKTPSQPVAQTQVLTTNEGRKLQIHDFAVSITIKQDEFNDWNSGYAYYRKEPPLELDYKKRITNEIYAVFQDVFDVIFFVSNNKEEPATLPYAAILSGVSNQIEGIGKILGTDKSFGSNSKLKAISHFGYIDGIKHGPSLHELSHIWSNYILETKITGCSPSGSKCDSFIDVSGGFHWNISNVRGHAGFYYGIKSVNLEKKTFKKEPFDCSVPGWTVTRCGGNMWAYAPLELYLMGLISKNQVPDIETYSGFEKTDIQGEFKIKNITHSTIEDIIKKFGERKPSFENSQKEFRILTILITTRNPTNDEWTALRDQMQWLTHRGADDNPILFNFWEATGGRASLVSDGLLRLIKS